MPFTLLRSPRADSRIARATAWLEARPSGQLLEARRGFFGVHRVFLRAGPAIAGVDVAGRKTSMR